MTLWWTARVLCARRVCIFNARSHTCVQDVFDLRLWFTPFRIHRELILRHSKTKGKPKMRRGLVSPNVPVFTICHFPVLLWNYHYLLIALLSTHNCSLVHIVFYCLFGNIGRLLTCYLVARSSAHFSSQAIIFKQPSYRI